MTAVSALDERPDLNRLSPSRPVRDLRGLVRSSSAGLKGRTLATLAAAHLPLPATLVEELSSWPLEAPAAADLRRRTHALLSGGRVIVRASRAGERAAAERARLDSVSDVVTFDDLLAAIQTCWRDVPAAQTLLIQRQVTCALSGFARRGSDSTSIEFTSGPIAAMAAGWVEPGCAFVRHQDGSVGIHTPASGTKAARTLEAHLSRRLLLAIDSALGDAERALGTRVVLEWAVSPDHTLWILAARPDTRAAAVRSAPESAPAALPSPRTKRGGRWPRWRVTIRWHWPTAKTPRLAPA